MTATYGAGLQWMGGGIASPETCPQSTTIRYSITTEDGLVTSGSIGIAGPSGNAVVTLASGRTVKFIYDLLPGGACIKAILR